MTDFSPREIVSELDRFIIGQGDAKRAVAIALRNDWDRMQLDDVIAPSPLNRARSAPLRSAAAGRGGAA